MKMPARIYALESMLNDILKDRSVEQLINGAALPGLVGYGLAMPDCHEGYAVPIGFVGAVRTKNGVISPGACGFDINCGVRLLKSEYRAKDTKEHLTALADELQKRIPSGLGQGRKSKLGYEQIEKILTQGAGQIIEQGCGEAEDLENCESGGKLAWADAKTVSDCAKRRGQDQVGTLGSGNHFLEVQKVADIFDEKITKIFGLFKDQIVIMIHCGSRGLGHQVCSDYLKEFIPLMIGKYKIQMPDKEFACVPFNSPEGQRYFKAMAAAANYAWANRQMITHFVRQAWQNVFGKQGSSLTLLYDVAHNIIKKEEYFMAGQTEELIIHRKGATRAFPPGHPEVPKNYSRSGQPTLLPGTMGTASYVMVGQETGQAAFFSTSHGAGRQMSRQAALRSFSGQNVINQLKSRGILISCRSKRGIAEEAPLAYKNIEEVVETVDRAGLSKKVARLTPLFVLKGE